MLTQAQSDAVFDVMASYEGFLRMVAKGDHELSHEMLATKARRLLDEARETMCGPAQADEVVDS